MTPGGLPVRVTNLTKRFGQVAAVTDLSFSVEPGAVTGFLGPNGSGKTTTMRMMLDLVSPTSGGVTIGGRRYADLAHPSRTVGAILDATGFHPGRTARDHLRVYADLGGHPARRVAEVINQLDMTAFADRPTRGFSTGMRQRLSLATALLGDAPVLLLDEPGNGLDPEGTAWLRRLLRTLAGEGRTVLVSSHVLSEMEQLVDRAVVIRHGRLVATGSVAELSALARPGILVRSPDAVQLAARLRAGAAPAVRIEPVEPGTLRVGGLTQARIADTAAAHGIPVHELTPERSSLEQVFLHLTTDGTEDTR